MPASRSSPCFISAIAVVALIALGGCGEDDPRLAYGQTRYLGGAYGDSPVASTAPVDNVSYWDGEGVPGKPSVKISLGEQRAYFYKSGQLVGISQLSTGREGLGTPAGQYKITQKMLSMPPAVTAITDANDNVVVPNIDNEKDPNRPDPLQRRADAVFHAHRRASACMWATSQVTPPRMVAFDAGIHGGGLSITSKSARRLRLSRRARPSPSSGGFAVAQG
jgi:hypothetical protein